MRRSIERRTPRGRAIAHKAPGDAVRPNAIAMSDELSDCDSKGILNAWCRKELAEHGVDSRSATQTGERTKS
jgi:hypothetical protein